MSPARAKWERMRPSGDEHWRSFGSWLEDGFGISPSASGYNYIVGNQGSHHVTPRGNDLVTHWLGWVSVRFVFISGFHRFLSSSFFRKSLPSSAPSLSSGQMLQRLADRAQAGDLEEPGRPSDS